MGAVLTRIEDPRDNLMKMTRDELYDYGMENGVEFPQGRDTPAFDGTSHPVPNMVAILRARGLPGRDKSHRVLGLAQPLFSDPPPSYSNKIIPKAPPPEPSLTWREPEELPTVDKMTMGQLRKECKILGLKMSRRDNMNTLREKLRGQNAA
jgi:hypothetical protein